MEQILRDEETPLILRIKIFEIILNRTYGRVPAKVDVTSIQDAVEAAQARLDAIFARGLMTGDEPDKEATPAIVVDQERDGEKAIVVLSDGTIAEEGSPRDLLTQKDSAFHRMAQLQTASAEWSI